MPVEKVDPICVGTLQRTIQRVEAKYGHRTPYTRRLRLTDDVMFKNDLTGLSYEAHAPMLINREKGLRILQMFPDTAFRSTYGNYYQIGGEPQRDCKILNLVDCPPDDRPFVSTSDKSFRSGNVGKCIRSKFCEPCRYEIDIEPRESDIDGFEE